MHAYFPLLRIRSGVETALTSAPKPDRPGLWARVEISTVWLRFDGPSNGEKTDLCRTPVGICTQSPKLQNPEKAGHFYLPGSRILITRNLSPSSALPYRQHL